MACLKGVVAVDDGDGAFVAVLELCGNGVSLDSLDIIAVVVNDVENGNALFKGSVLGQLYQAFLLEKEKSAGAVAVVSGDDDGCAFGNFGDAGNAVAVDAERLIVDNCRGDEVGAVGLIVAVEVGAVLEVVCIESAFGKSLVGQDVIVIDNDVQGVALFCESVLDLLEDLGMRNCGRTDGDLGLC